MDLPTQQAPGGMSALPDQAPARLLHAHVSAPVVSLWVRDPGWTGTGPKRGGGVLWPGPLGLGRGRAPFRTGPCEGRGVSASVSAAVGPKA